MKYPLIVGLLSAGLLFPALLHAEETSDNEPVKAVIVINNPKALHDAVFKNGQAPADGQVNLDGSTLERINPRPDDERPDSEPAGMNSEDTGTPGNGGIEVTTIGRANHAHGGNEFESEVGVAIGFHDNIEFNIEKTAVRETGNGEPAFQGAGPTEVGAKWRFYDKKGLTMAVAPAYTFNDATRRRDETGAKLPGEGASVYIPLILSKELGKWTLTTNVGVRRNLQEGENSYVTSVAVGRSLNDTSRVMGEVYTERDSRFRNLNTYMTVGYVKVLNSDKFKNYEASLITTVGRSLGRTDDGRSHTTFSIGISIARKPRG